MTDTAAWIEWREAVDGLHLEFGGSWRIGEAAALDRRLKEMPDAKGSIRVDLAPLVGLDTTGALLISRSLRQFRDAGCDVSFDGARVEHARLIETVTRAFQPCETEPPVDSGITRILVQVGSNTLEILDTVATSVAFFGRASTVFARTVTKPERLRLRAVIRHMETAGLDAVPIVCLMSFLIGIVLAYQGAIQLKQFGAEIFVVDLLALSVLRELGVLLTSIMVAGRSGSAFAAQIGSMRLREEVDAMRVLGMDPMEVLVLPRVVALVVTLPLLTFIADLVGLVGGAVMSWVALDIGPTLFLDRLKSVVTPAIFWVGMVKAPVFAVLIALVGCYEGYQVSGSAESVGERTTRAVVESIFLVIVVDALFSVLFGILGI